MAATANDVNGLLIEYCRAALNGTLPSAGSGGTGASAPQVQGAGASGATAVGNPVGVGGIYSSTLPTLTNGFRGNVQLTDRGQVQTGLFIGANQVGGYNLNVDGAESDVSLATIGFNAVYNGTTWDRQRGDTTGTWVVPGILPTATNRSGTATTTSGGLNVPANAARKTLTGQNISTVVIGFNEFGGTAAIGTAGTYTVPAGGSFSISTQNAVNFIAASGTAAVTMTET